MEKQLEDNGLSGLAPLLSRTGSFIAGSFAMSWNPLVEGGDNRDIDIWIPAQTNQLVVVADFVSFLVRNGYGWPSSFVRRNSTRPSHYRRLDKTLAGIFTLRKTGRPPIQLLQLLSDTCPISVVSNFDIRILKRWYTGTETIVLGDAHEDHINRSLVVNMASNDVRNQTLNEWVRTVARLVKYAGRGFKIKWDGDVLDPLLRARASEHVQGVDDLIKAWNLVVSAVVGDIPFLTYNTDSNTVCTTYNDRFTTDTCPLAESDISPADDVRTDVVQPSICQKDV